MGHRRAELEEKIRWWEREHETVRHLLNTYTRENGRLMNQISQLRSMLERVSCFSPGKVDQDLFRKIRELLEDPHIGDNP